MDVTNDVSNKLTELVDEVSNAVDNDMSINLAEPTNSCTGNNVVANLPTNNEPTLIRIIDINTDISYLWKIQAIVTCEYPKRSFTNTHGSGEISSWDLTDESGSISLIAFNLNSYVMGEKLRNNRAYEFTNLSVRLSIDAYKTLPHQFQLTCSNGTNVHEIDPPFVLQGISYNFIPLSEIAALPLNSIIDVQVHVLRDFGISTGVKNDNIWTRRDIHVSQDGVHIGITLWNDQARLINRNMAGLRIKLKNVKVSWFDGARMLITLANTQITTMRN